MNRQHQLILVSVLGLVILSGIDFNSVLLTNRPPARIALSRVTIGGPLTLTAADGRTVTDRTYRGKWLLVYFGYTFCPDTCATTLNELSTMGGGAAAKACERERTGHTGARVPPGASRSTALSASHGGRTIPAELVYSPLVTNAGGDKAGLTLGPV